MTLFNAFFICFLLVSCGNFVGFSSDDDPQMGNLPIFNLFMEDEDLATLYDSVSLESYASCRYTSDVANGVYGDSSIRIRGFTSRMKPKKSFTLLVEEDEEDLKYALDAGGDPWISYALIMYAYSLVGLPAVQLEPMALYLNDEYMGLYNRIRLYNEDVDSFYNESGELFKIKASDMGTGLSAEESSEKKYPDNDDYSSLNRLFVNASHMDEEDWVSWIEANGDLESIAAYMVIRDYFGMADTRSTNFYIYSGDSYRILPWDNDHYFDDSADIGGNNILTRRMLESEVFQDYYRDYFNRFILDKSYSENILDKLSTYASDLAALVDTAAAIEPVFYLEYSDFLAEQSSISDFLSDRGSIILSDSDWYDFFNEE